LIQPQKSELQQGLGAVEQAKTAYNDLSSAKGAFFGSPASGNQAAKPGLVADVSNWLNKPGPAQQLPSASATQSGLVAPPVAASDPAQVADAGSWANQGFDIPTSVYRGGLMRHHYDGGGSANDDPETEEGLYKTPGPGLDIPEVNPNAKLATPGAPGSSSGGGNPLSAVTGLASAAGTIGNGIGDILGFLALKNGGLVPREHHADGDSVGNVDGPDVPAPDAVEANASVSPIDAIWPKIIKQESGGRHFDKDGNPLTSPAGAIGIAQVMPGTAPEAAKLAGVPFDEARFYSDPDYNNALGKAYYKAQLDKYGDAGLAAAAYNAGPGAVDKAISQASAKGGSPMDYLPSETRKYVTNVTSNANAPGLAGAAPTRVAQADTGTTSDAGPQGGGLAPAGGFLDQAGDFFTKHQNAIVPILTGLATMASSPSRYLGSAILQGLGGGAQAYENLQNQLANRAQIEAGTGFTQAQTGTQNTITGGNLADIARKSIYSAGGHDWVMLPNGGQILVGQWLSMPPESRPMPLGGKQAADAIAASYGGNAGVVSPVPPIATIKGTPLPPPTTGGRQPAAEPAISAAAQPASTGPSAAPKYLGSEAVSTIKSDFDRLQTMPNDAKNSEKTISNNTEASINTAAVNARQQGSTLNQLSTQLMAMPTTGALSGGPLMSLKTTLIGKVNDFARTLGIPGMQIKTDEIATNIASDKLSKMMQFATAHGADQNSLGALQTASAIVPSNSIPKDAALKIVAGLYVDKQRGIDPVNYLNEYKNAVSTAHPGQGDLYLSQNALTAFSKDHNDAQYGQEKVALEKALNTMHNGSPLLTQLHEGKITPEFFDAQAQKAFGVKNLSRYILNN